MQNLSARAETLRAHSDAPIEPFHAVVLYDEISAGKRGVSTLARLAGLREEDVIEVRPRLWRFDFLKDRHGYVDAALDLAAAKMIIISTDGVTPLPDIIKDWLTDVFEQKRGHRFAVAALLGSDEPSALSASEDMQFIEDLASKVEVDFFAPCFSRI
ncbi:MAG TPA: hypothetical protein VGC39_05725 [Candidatus Methylacidiphilales bacterium]